MVVERDGKRPVQYRSTCSTGTQGRVLSTWDLRSGLVSLVPGLGDALGVVGINKKEEKKAEKKNYDPNVIIQRVMELSCES